MAATTAPKALKLALLPILLVGSVFVAQPVAAQSASITVGATVLSTDTAKESLDRAEATIVAVVAQGVGLVPRRTMTPSGVAAVVSESITQQVTDPTLPVNPALPAVPPTTKKQLRITISYVAN